MLYKIYHVQGGWPEYLETDTNKETLEKLISEFDHWTLPKSLWGSLDSNSVPALVLFLKERGIEAKVANLGIELEAHLR